MRVNRTIRRSLIRVKITRKTEAIKTKLLSIINKIRMKWIIRRRIVIRMTIIVQMIVVTRLFNTNGYNNDNCKNDGKNENNDQTNDQNKGRQNNNNNEDNDDTDTDDEIIWIIRIIMRMTRAMINNKKIHESWYNISNKSWKKKKKKIKSKNKGDNDSNSNNEIDWITTIRIINITIKLKVIKTKLRRISMMIRMMT